MFCYLLYITDGESSIYRTQMSKQERENRSRLKRYISYKEFIRGTLSIRERVCGKPNCKCQRGEKHVSLFLTRSKGGRIEQLYIPREKEQLVRRLVKNYRDVRDLLEKISSINWEKLKSKPFSDAFSGMQRDSISSANSSLR